MISRVKRHTQQALFSPDRTSATISRNGVATRLPCCTMRIRPGCSTMKRRSSPACVMWTGPESPLATGLRRRAVPAATGGAVAGGALAEGVPVSSGHCRCCTQELPGESLSLQPQVAISFDDTYAPPARRLVAAAPPPRRPQQGVARCSAIFTVLNRRRRIVAP